MTKGLIKKTKKMLYLKLFTIIHEIMNLNLNTFGSSMTASTTTALAFETTKFEIISNKRLISDGL